MNNDELFRQALQRQNDRAARMKMPHDMEQRVKNRIKSENNARHSPRSHRCRGRQHPALIDIAFYK